MASQQWQLPTMETSRTDTRLLHSSSALSDAYSRGTDRVVGRFRKLEANTGA